MNRRFLGGKVNLKNEADVKWLLIWCRRRPTIFLNIIKGTIQQLTENNESECVLFSLDDFMELEFKSWLCICEHEYLKLVQVTLFDEVIDRNLMFDHNLFTCQELIKSGMFVINLAILKSFVDDRNIFINNVDKPQYKSQHIEKVLTNSLSMTIGCIPEKSPDHGTSVITTPNSAHNFHQQMRQ